MLHILVSITPEVLLASVFLQDSVPGSDTGPEDGLFLSVYFGLSSTQKTY